MRKGIDRARVFEVKQAANRCKMTHHLKASVRGCTSTRGARAQPQADHAVMLEHQTSTRRVEGVPAGRAGPRRVEAPRLRGLRWARRKCPTRNRGHGSARGCRAEAQRSDRPAQRAWIGPNERNPRQLTRSMQRRDDVGRHGGALAAPPPHCQPGREGEQGNGYEQPDGPQPCRVSR
jgi:hypothetical protein